MLRRIVLVLLAAAATGCATQKLANPEVGTGPTAMVSDYTVYESNGKSQVFAMTELDGQEVLNTFQASREASYGRGFNLHLVIKDRLVPVRPMKVKIKASHMTAAPIHEIASRASGNFFSVEGIVDFDPKPDGRYYVKGLLGSQGSSVWIEDEATGKPATAVVSKQ